MHYGPSCVNSGKLATDRMLVPVLEKGFTKDDEDTEVAESMEATKGE